MKDSESFRKENGKPGKPDKVPAGVKPPTPKDLPKGDKVKEKKDAV